MKVYEVTYEGYCTSWEWFLKILPAIEAGGERT